MKIVFIKLKELYRIDPYSDPPLGLLSVITSIKDKHEVIFCDMTHETKIPNADAYAISSCTLEYPELIKIANRIKKQKKKPIVVGGPHFDLLSYSYWQKEIINLPIDIICRGEGEFTMPIALTWLEIWSNLPQHEQRIVNQNYAFLDLATLPFPAREFLDRKKYFKEGTVFQGDTFKKGNSSTIMLSRGCPFACAFCASPLLHHRKLRFRSLQQAIKEIELLITEYNVTELRFQDDCFVFNLKKYKEFAEILHQLDIRYRCSSRVDQIDDEILEQLWHSGCREIGFGIESAENSILNLLVKKTNVELNREVLIKTKQTGFKVRAFMMTGLPGETKDSAKIAIDFLEETNPDVVTLTSFTPLPGSDIYNNPDKYGVTILSKDWSMYNMAIKRDGESPWMHSISTATLDEMESNRELLKEYLFNNNKFNVKEFNKPYKRRLNENSN